MGKHIVSPLPGGDIAKGIAKGVTKATTKGATKIAPEPVQEVANLARASTVKVADVLPNGEQPTRAPFPSPTARLSFARRRGAPVANTPPWRHDRASHAIMRDKLVTSQRARVTIHRSNACRTLVCLLVPRRHSRNRNVARHVARREHDEHA